MVSRESSQSKIILGTVQMGMAYGINNHSGKILFHDCHEVLKTAYSMKVSTLDTAELYGESHRIIGEFHRLNPNMPFKVITKLPGANLPGNLYHHIRKYLSELVVDKLEGLMFHSFNSYHSNQKAALELVAMKGDQLFAKLGVSVYTNSEFEYAILDKKIDVIQLPYNLLDNSSKRGYLLDMARQYQKTIHTRSAFLQGLFFMKSEHFPEQLRELVEPVNYLRSLANRCNMNMIQFAISYVLSNENVDGIVIGVDNVRQLQQLARHKVLRIPDEIRQAIETIKINNNELLDPRKWALKK